MPFAIPPERITDLIAATALFLLAAWLFYLRPGNRLHQAFSLLLTLRGLFFLLTAVQGLDAASLDFQYRLVLYPIIALPFAAFYFGYRFRNRFAPPPPSGPANSQSFIPWLLLAGAILALGFYATNHELFLGRPAWFAPLWGLEMLSYVALAALFLRDAARSPLATDRKALQLVATGLVFEAAHHSAHRALRLHPFPPNGPVYTEPALVTSWVTWLIVLAAVIVLAVAHFLRARHDSDLGTRAIARRQLQFLALPLATGAVTGILPQLFPRVEPTTYKLYVVLEGLWAIAFAACLAYAILRLQLFHIELGAKLFVRKGTIAGSFMSVFFVAQESAKTFVEAGTGSTWIGLLATTILVLFFAPLQRFGDSLSQKAFPHVTSNRDYEETRGRELYRAMFEASSRDGRMTTKDRAMLASLRARFRMTPREVKQLEREVLQALGHTLVPEHHRLRGGANAAR